MNPWLLRLAVALFLPAIAFSWRHSRLVAAALTVPFVANLVDMLGGPSLPPEHPARVLVPLISAALGFGAAWHADRDGWRAVSPAFVLGTLTAAIGILDVFAGPYFVARSEWFPLWMNACMCLLFVVVAKGKLPCLTSSSP